MTWNYRIFRHEHKIRFMDCDNVWYGLHEVFYNEKGYPVSYAINPEAVGDTIEDLESSVALMLSDIRLHRKAIKEGKKHYIQDGKKSKLILEEKDFDEDGVYYKYAQEFGKEIEEDISTTITLTTSTNANIRKSKRTRKVG